MDEKLTLFIAVTAVAVVLQMLILLGIYFAVRKLSARMEALADRVEDATNTLQVRVLPVIDNVKSIQQDVKAFVETARPKVDLVLDNLSYISTTARGSVERIDTTVNDAVDRMRLQVIRGDEMLTRTMDRIEETTEQVQRSVLSPVRRVSGIVQAISIGVGSYLDQQKRRRNGGPSDEMFI
jgi:methyl-accepting chemotaxis protein